MGVRSLRGLGRSGRGAKEGSSGIVRCHQPSASNQSHARGEPFLGEGRGPRSSLGEYPHKAEVETGQEQPEAREEHPEHGGSQKLCQESFRPGGGATVQQQICSLTSMLGSPAAPGGRGRHRVLPGQDFCDSIPVFFGTSERVEKLRLWGFESNA